MGKGSGEGGAGAAVNFVAGRLRILEGKVSTLVERIAVLEGAGCDSEGRHRGAGVGGLEEVAALLAAAADAGVQGEGSNDESAGEAISGEESDVESAGEAISGEDAEPVSGTSSSGVGHGSEQQAGEQYGADAAAGLLRQCQPLVGQVPTKQANAARFQGMQVMWTDLTAGDSDSEQEGHGNGAEVLHQACHQEQEGQGNETEVLHQVCHQAKQVDGKAGAAAACGQRFHAAQPTTATAGVFHQACRQEQEGQGSEAEVLHQVYHQDKQVDGKAWAAAACGRHFHAAQHATATAWGDRRRRHSRKQDPVQQGAVAEAAATSGSRLEQQQHGHTEHLRVLVEAYGAVVRRHHTIRRLGYLAAPASFGRGLSSELLGGPWRGRCCHALRQAAALRRGHWAPRR